MCSGQYLQCHNKNKSKAMYRDEGPLGLVIVLYHSRSISDQRKYSHSDSRDVGLFIKDSGFSPLLISGYFRPLDNDHLKTPPFYTPSLSAENGLYSLRRLIDI